MKVKNWLTWRNSLASRHVEVTDGKNTLLIETGYIDGVGPPRTRMTWNGGELPSEFGTFLEMYKASLRTEDCYEEH